MSPSNATVGPVDTAESVMRLRGVDRAFALPTGPVRALQGIDLDVGAIGLTVLTGPSGCGKTTLLNLAFGAERADAGTVEVCGADIARLSAAARRRLRRDTVGIALARPSDNLVERLDVAANLRMAARLRGVPVDLAEALSPFGLAPRTRANVEELSGGEQQRLAIAIALLGAARLVLLDEPTAELDAETGRSVVEYLHTHARRCAVVIASHDPFVVEAADVVITLEQGRRVA